MKKTLVGKFLIFLVLFVLLFFGLAKASSTCLPREIEDTDGDCLPDVWEYEYFGNLLQTAGGDFDKDLLTNLQEYQLKTDPSKPDTDGDGFTDYEEYIYGTDPINPEDYPLASLNKITLVRPKYGVSAVSPFDLVIKTSNYSHCKYTTNSDEIYDTIDNSQQFFTTTDGYTHTKKNFPVASYVETEIYVFCKSKDQFGKEYFNDNFPGYFRVSVDYTEPVMIRAYADPEYVIEKLEVQLVAETDDETACRFFPYDKYDQISEVEELFKNINMSEFLTRSVLELTKNTNPRIEDRKEYVFIVACMNKAEKMVLSYMSFKVDLTIGNEIAEIFPVGIINTKDTEIRVVTNKDSTCYYGQGYLNKFPQENSKIHFINRFNLEEGLHEFPVKCVFSDASEVDLKISFKVDTVKPEITKLNVQTFPCDNSRLRVEFLSEDINGIEYYNLTLSDFSANVLFNITTVSEVINIENLNLSHEKRYFVDLKVKDKAGNIASNRSSDITVMSPDDIICINKLPELIIKNTTLTKDNLRIMMSCHDPDGQCEPIYYHVINESCSSCGSCDYKRYNPLYPLLVPESTKICYNLTDDKDENMEDFFEVVFTQCDEESLYCCNNRSASYCLTQNNCTIVSSLNCQIDEELEGCLYNNPSCEEGYECKNNVCVELVGCKYSNPVCLVGYECINNECTPIGTTPEGCAHNNPSCQTGYECVNNNCVLVTPECIEKWSCTSFQPLECPSSGIRTRTCTDENSCGTAVDRPSERETCTYIEPEPEKKSNFLQILFIILGISSLGGGLFLLYKNPKDLFIPKSSNPIMNLSAAGTSNNQGMSFQPNQGMGYGSFQRQKQNSKIIINSSNLDHEIRKQRDIMKLREMSTIFDQFAEDSQKPEKIEKIEKIRKKKKDRLEELSKEDVFEEIERLSKKRKKT